MSMSRERWCLSSSLIPGTLEIRNASAVLRSSIRNAVSSSGK